MDLIEERVIEENLSALPDGRQAIGRGDKSDKGDGFLSTDR